jgi:hypothetical protein
MARKSGFTQFAENFQSAYGMVNDFEKERTSRGIADEKQTEEFDDAGNFVGWKYNDELTPEKRATDTMRGLRTNRIADNLERYGDRSGATDLRTSQAAYRETQNKNKKFDATYDASVAAANAKSGLTTQEANLSITNNQVLVDFSKLRNEGNFDEPGSAKTWLMAEFDKSGDPRISNLINGMDDNTLGQTLNDGVQLRAQAEKALIGGIASTRKMLDGINLDGKGTLIRNENGSFTFDEFLEDGSSIPGAAIQGKDWTEFQANVRSRLDPMNSITIALSHSKIAQAKADLKLTTAQAAEAYSKATSGDANKAKLAYYKNQNDFLSRDPQFMAAFSDYTEKKTEANYKKLRLYYDNYYANNRDLYDPKATPSFAESVGGTNVNVNTGVGGNNNDGFSMVEVPAPDGDNTGTPVATVTPVSDTGVATDSSLVNTKGVNAKITTLKAEISKMSSKLGVGRRSGQNKTLQRLKKELKSLEDLLNLSIK